MGKAVLAFVVHPWITDASQFQARVPRMLSNVVMFTWLVCLAFRPAKRSIERSEGVDCGGYQEEVTSGPEANTLYIQCAIAVTIPNAFQRNDVCLACVPRGGNRISEVADCPALNGCLLQCGTACRVVSKVASLAPYQS